MNSDTLTVVFSYVGWEETARVCSTVSTLWRRASLLISRKHRQRLLLLEENVNMALEDPATNEELAIRWLAEKVSRNRWFGRPPEPVVGCLCDTADFQNSFCFATIVGSMKRRVTYGLLAPYTVVHTTNAIRANLSPFNVVRSKTEVQYLVRFLGWSDRWNEWKSLSALFPLGSKTMTFEGGRWVSKHTQQWIVRKNKRSGFWQLCLYSRFADSPHDALPLTDVTASLLVSRKLNFKRI